MGVTTPYSLPSCEQVLPRVKGNLFFFSANYILVALLIGMLTAISNFMFLLSSSALAYAWNQVDDCAVRLFCVSLAINHVFFPRAWKRMLKKLWQNWAQSSLALVDAKRYLHNITSANLTYLCPFRLWDWWQRLCFGFLERVSYCRFCIIGMSFTCGSQFSQIDFESYTQFCRHFGSCLFPKLWAPGAATGIFSTAARWISRAKPVI